MKIESIMRKAKHMAEMSDFWRQQMGCVVMYKKKIIATGFNTSKTHPLQKEYNKIRFQVDHSPHCMHAELHALIGVQNMDIDWSRVKVYTYRICHGNPKKAAYARPCPACQALMRDMGIKHIYYTTSTTPVHEVLD